MKVHHYASVAPTPVQDIEQATQGLAIRQVISAVDGGATDFTMDIFEIQPGGHSEGHAHPWEHQAFVIRGTGILVGAEGDKPFGEGDVIFVAPNEFHQFRNVGQSPVEFLCLIPKAALTA